MEDESGEKRKLGRNVESLGWLASSGVQPKKRKEIHGVSATSLIALKTQLAQSQQEAAAVREGRLDAEELRVRRQRGSATDLNRRNTGVAERDARDRLELRSSSQRASDSRAALERKAELYDRLARGEVEAGEEQYEVDFLLKEPLDTAELAAGSRSSGLFSSDMAQERQRREWEAEVHENLSREEEAEQRREAQRQTMEEVVAEAEEDRARAAVHKAARAEAEARKRERLKAAFMKKQLQQRKAGGKAGAASAAQQAAGAKQQQQQEG